MEKKELKNIFGLFLAWRILLFVFLSIAVGFVSLQKNFLGGGLANYLQNPYFWAWLNFDGEHYLSLAQIGYQPLTYFYFPLYPLLAKFLATFINKSFVNLAFSGLLVSNISFLFALIGFWKLILLDYKEKVALASLIFLVLFPTSFYFGSFYTESTFLALVIWSFYFARHKHWLLAGFLGGLSTATRLVGIALLPALFLEMYKTYKKNIPIYSFLSLFLIPLGLACYMYYLYMKTGDPLEFFHSVSIFGQQRSSTFILLPQVFYRYFFKVIPNLNYNFLPVVFTTFLELITALVFTALTILSFWRLRLSYAIYTLFAFIIPTLSGSFSSLPRYVLALFPAFILTALYISSLKKPIQYLIFLILFISLVLATALFVRGYWVA